VLRFAAGLLIWLAAGMLNTAVVAVGLLAMPESLP
jgi:hypothetical protein